MPAPTLAGTNSDPRVGGPFADKGPSLAVDDCAGFLNDDLCREGFGAVFASPSNYRTHRLSYPVDWGLVAQASRFYFQ